MFQDGEIAGDFFSFCLSLCPGFVAVNMNLPVNKDIKNYSKEYSISQKYQVN